MAGPEDLDPEEARELAAALCHLARFVAEVLDTVAGAMRDFLSALAEVPEERAARLLLELEAKEGGDPDGG